MRLFEPDVLTERHYSQEERIESGILLERVGKMIVITLELANIGSAVGLYENLRESARAGNLILDVNTVGPAVDIEL